MEEKTNKEFDSMTLEVEFSSILMSDLTSEEKNLLLDSYWPKEDDEIKMCSSSSDMENKHNGMEVKTKGALDPHTTEGIQSTLDSNLDSNEKSTSMPSHMTEEDNPPSKNKTCSNPSGVEVEEKLKPAHNLILSSDEKPLSLACNPKVEDIIPLSEVETSTTSSGLQDKNEKMQMEASGGKDSIPGNETQSPKGTNKNSLCLAQKVHVEDRHFSIEIKEIVVRMEEYHNDFDGEKMDWIWKDEAVCKYCFKCMLEENDVLRARCQCKLTLIHRDCSIKWSEKRGSKCPTCEEEIENISVALKLLSSFSPPKTEVEKPQKASSISKRYWCCLCDI